MTEANECEAVQGSTCAIQIGIGHWLIESRTYPGEFYAVDDGICTCRASDCHKPCWHVRAIKDMEEMSCNGK